MGIEEAGDQELAAAIDSGLDALGVDDVPSVEDDCSWLREAVAIEDSDVLNGGFGNGSRNGTREHLGRDTFFSGRLLDMMSADLDSWEQKCEDTQGGSEGHYHGGKMQARMSRHNSQLMTMSTPLYTLSSTLVQESVFRLVSCLRPRWLSTKFSLVIVWVFLSK